MNPKSGKAGKAVEPMEPTEASEADTADPGGIASARADPAKGEPEDPGRTKFDDDAPPHKADDTKTSWVEIELIDQDDEPVPGERYRIELPDGSVDSGSLDANGIARVEGIDPGTCKVSFPDLDKDAWGPA